VSLWLGSLIVAGAAAAIIFPTMKRLKPSLPDYASYSGEHWSLAGGQIAARIFWLADVIQVACLVIAGLSFGAAIVWFGTPMRSRLTMLRATLLLLALAVAGYRLGLLEPGLTDALRGYWAAALAGDNEAAARLKQVFDDAHPMQTRLMSGTAALLVCLIAGGIGSIVREPGRERGELEG
jgi:hypothetical protein